MIVKDLIEKSPVRKFEQALGGGLKHGEIGVVTSKKGLGKTSMLVQIGLDQLLQGKCVVHISFSQQTDYTLVWYSDMFDELAKKKNLENEKAVKNEMVSRRIVLNFNQDIVRTEQILATVKALSQGGGIKPDVLMIDDFNFENACPEAMKTVKEFAAKENISVWYTASCDVQKYELPCALKPFIEDIDIVLYLESANDFIKIKALKEHGKNDLDTGVKFDVKTMLLSEK